MKILTVGDSNTYGFDPRTGGAGRYPTDVRWTGRLALLPGVRVVNLGMNGACIPPDGAYAGDAARRERPDWITVMLGTNDLLMDPDTDPAEVGRSMERYLRDLLARTPEGTRTLLISPPAMEAGLWTNDGLVEASAVLGAYLKPVADGLGVRFADAALWGTELCFDGIHLSERGHAVFAEEIRKALGLSPQDENRM